MSAWSIQVPQEHCTRPAHFDNLSVLCRHCALDPPLRCLVLRPGMVGHAQPGSEHPCSGLREPRQHVAPHPQPHSRSSFRGANHSHRLPRGEAVRVCTHIAHSVCLDSRLLHVLQAEPLPLHQSGVAVCGSQGAAAIFGRNHRSL